MRDIGIGHNGAPDEDDVPVCPSGVDPNGWVAIHRSIIDHWLVGFGKNMRAADPARGSFNCGEAFMFLIFKAKYRDGYINNGGRKMLLRRGQLAGAVFWLASVWNWTPKAVRGFLDKLEDDGMITRQLASDQGQVRGRSKGRLANIITIGKYAEFQDVHRQQGQVDDTEKGRFGAGSGQVKGHIYMEEQGKQGKQGNNKADAEAGARASLGEEGQSRFAKPGPDFDGLQARLLEAANGALANPAVAPGLLTLAEPLNWIDAGADLDRDILPAIVEVSGKHKLRARAKPISSWGYFANRVAELKAAREAGLPTIVLDQTGPTGIRGKSKFEMLRDVVAKHNAKFEGSRS